MNVQVHSCPVRAIMHRVLRLKLHHAPGNTPLNIFFNWCGRHQAVSAVMITSILCAASLTIPGHVGVNTNKISARSICNSGSVALLLGGVGPNKILIISQWHSDVMFHYLHGYALTLIQYNFQHINSELIYHHSPNVFKFEVTKEIH